MTQETPTPPRPADPFTGADGIRLYTLISDMTKRIESALVDLSGRIASQQKSQLDMLKLLNVIEEGLATSRVGRLELEILEAQQEKDLAERRLRISEEKLNLKQSVKDNQVDTDEKIKAVAAASYADLEKKRRDADDAYLLDLRRSIIKAVLTTLSVGATGSILAFLFWLIKLYINRGAP